jgi:adenylate kinase family enzyme
MKNSCQQYTTLFIQRILTSKKVAVIGNQGAGKTTLALNLAKIIGIEYIEVVWVEVKDDIPKLREKMYPRDNWIIDGEFGLLDLADIIIFLDFPFFLCLVRGIKRGFKNFLDWNFFSIASYLKISKRVLHQISWIIDVCQHPLKKRPELLTETNVLSQKKNIITLKTPQELELLLEALKRGK